MGFGLLVKAALFHEVSYLEVLSDLFEIDLEISRNGEIVPANNKPTWSIWNANISN